MSRFIPILLVTLCLPSWCLAADDKADKEDKEAKVALKTEIPEEVLAGTPPDVLAKLFPKLLPPPTAKRPAFMVPKGTVNLAIEKKVTSSEERPIVGELKFVTDGKKEGSDETFVELSPQPQWVQIDLEKPSKIYAIFLWHYFREARGYRDVIIQVSDDPKFAKGVKTIYNNDQDNSSKKGIGKDRPYMESNLGKIIDAKGAKGRYVRLYSNGNTANNMNHYVEVEIFGKPAS